VENQSSHSAPLLTTRELAAAIGASESSVRRWTNDGTIATARTAGGHRRIAFSDAIRFIRETGTPVIRPEVLGLPPVVARAAGKSLGNEALIADLNHALHTGHAAAAIGCIVGLFLNGQNAASICDRAIQPAMKRVGQLWLDDPRAILTEHRATAICVSGLSMLRRMIGEPANHAPVALGGAPDGDPYLLPSMMAGTVLAEAGYRDLNFGPDLPLELLAVATQEHRASLVWLAVKVAADWTTLRSRIEALAKQLETTSAHFIIGGTGVTPDDLRPSKNISVMQTMSELAAFARGAIRQSPAM